MRVDWVGAEGAAGAEVWERAETSEGWDREGGVWPAKARERAEREVQAAGGAAAGEIGGGAGEAPEAGSNIEGPEAGALGDAKQNALRLDVRKQHDWQASDRNLLNKIPGLQHWVISESATIGDDIEPARAVVGGEREDWFLAK